MKPALTVAWFSFFPVEWLPDVPPEVQALPRLHPATWQRVLLAEFEKRSDLRLHILVVRKQFPRTFSFERNGVTFHLLKAPAGFRAPSLFWVDTLLVRRTLRTVQPDLVHAWGTDQGAALIASRLPYPHLVTIQGLYSWAREVGPVNKHELLASWVERRCLPRAPLITTESTFAADYLRRKFAPKQLMQIEHAPDPVFQRVQRQPRLSPRRFLFIGRFEPRKGADVLLRALDRLKAEMEFELLIVGRSGGPLYDALRRELSAELWQRAQFKQNLSSQQVAAELAEATLMIYPTLVDVSPNTVKEAVVAGVPVVASAVGGIPDYVVPGENGVLFEAGNVDACLRAVREACAHPLFGRGVVHEETHQRMREYLSPKRMGRRFWEAYQTVHQGSGAAPSR
jgi:glycosyltransferase involved in cell wall biosynthesis